jgi:hypothetical protein
MSSDHPITFVCCVESGGLEAQTIRMVQSLRRYGGRFATAPVVAVTPRFGPPLSRKTRQIFDQCEVQHLYLNSSNKRDQYSWYNFINKPLAILAAEERAETEAVGWLDGDLLILDEPDQLILQENEDFLACTTDHAGATTGADDPLEPFWQSICKTLNLDIEKLPWVVTGQERACVRYYFNSGVFVYRKSTGFAQQYLDTCIQLLNARISSRKCGLFFNEQTSLGLTAFQLNMPWRSLPYSHNFHAWKDQEALLRKAKIIHYHSAMWMPEWTDFLQAVQETHPEVGEWLHSFGPMENEAPLTSRLLGRYLKYIRSKKYDAHQKSCLVL